MPRRKRAQSDEYDDSIERRFFEKTNPQAAKKAQKEATKEPTAEDIELQRLKKKAKKLRQKEKKEDAKKVAAGLESAKAKEKEQQVEVKAEKKKRKEIDKKSPPTDEFIKTHKGVKYCDVVLGKGPVVEDRKKVRVKYILRANNKEGKIIDSSGNFGFCVGKGEVIQGWEIGLLRMKEGGTRHIIVPPGAGYGSKDIGAGSGGDLYFEVTLLKA